MFFFEVTFLWNIVELGQEPGNLTHLTQHFCGLWGTQLTQWPLHSLREDELKQMMALKDQVLLMERQLSDSQGWPLGEATKSSS